MPREKNIKYNHNPQPWKTLLKSLQCHYFASLLPFIAIKANNLLDIQQHQVSTWMTNFIDFLACTATIIHDIVLIIALQYGHCSTVTFITSEEYSFMDHA